jgi:hypothetical protein
MHIKITTKKLKMDKIKLVTKYKKRLADTITPVSIYLQIRDRFANPILLESSDYHGQEIAILTSASIPWLHFLSTVKL